MRGILVRFVLTHTHCLEFLSKYLHEYCNLTQSYIEFKLLNIFITGISRIKVFSYSSVSKRNVVARNKNQKILIMNLKVLNHRLRFPVGNFSMV